MLHNPNISQSLDSLPTFSPSNVDAILSDVNKNMQQSLGILNGIIEDIQKEKSRLPKGETSKELIDLQNKFVISSVVDECDCLVTAGFGTGIAIASGVSSSNPEIQKLDALMKEAIANEEKIRARVLGIRRINRDTNQVDVRAEIPNWSKTVGATLPSWSDPASKQNLAVMIGDQIKRNFQEIAAYRKNPAVTREKMAEVCSALFHAEFLIGVMEGLLYAKPTDFKEMTATYPVKGGGTISITGFFREIKKGVKSNDITGLVAGAVLNSK